MQPITILLAAAILAAPSFAQGCSTFANATPGTNISAGDDTTRNLALPFPFPFNGTIYTSIWINSNGSVSFGAGDTTFGDSEAGMLNGPPRIAVCWDDWYAPGAPAGGGIFFAPSATQVNIVWKNVPRFTAGPPANMEIVLGVSGEIDLYYDATMSVSTDSNIVGLSAGGGASPAAMSWTPLPASVNATNYQLFTNNVGLTPFNLVGSKIMLIPNGPSTYVPIPVAPSTCAPASYPGFATPSTTYGTGCPAAAPGSGGTFFEQFASSTVDLSNTSILFTALGANHYLAGPGPGMDNSFVPADAMVQGDDTQVTVGVGPMGSFPYCGAAVSSIAACSNGFLWMTPNLGNPYVPNASDFATQNPRIAPLWHDWNFNVGGTFFWSTGANYCMATWQNVGSFGVTGSANNTFQVKLFANGNIAFNYGTVLNNASTGGIAMAGLSHGGGTAGSSIDLSAVIATPVLVDLTIIVPLAHSATTTASFGLPYTLNLSNIPAGSSLGAFVIGFNQLNLSLTPLGMTGCTQYTTADYVAVQLFGGPTATFNLNIPYNVAYAGLNLFSQGAAFAPLNPFGVIASNGVQGTIGL